MTSDCMIYGPTYTKVTLSDTLLSESEEFNLGIRSKAGDLEARNELVIHNQRFLRKEVNAYHKRHQCLEVEDLLSEANIGLIRAAELFDPTKGFRFTTYAKYWILQALNSYASQNTGVIRLPANKGEKLMKICAAMTAADTSDSSTLATMTGIDIVTVEELLPFTANGISLDTEATTPSGEKGERMENFICHYDEDFDSNLEMEEFRAIIDSLPEKNREVLMFHSGTFGHEQMTLQQIADIYGITKERVRQIEIQAIKMCKDQGRDIA